MLLFLAVIDNEDTRNKLEQIYVHYKKPAYWTAYNILKDHHEAEDIIQEAIIKISKVIDNIEEVRCNKTKGLFVIIVRNLSINVYNKRKNKENTLYEDIEIVSEELSLDDVIVGLEESRIIAQKLNQIHPSYADILTLKYYNEYSNQEISELLNITEGNIRTRLHRAKAAIKKMLVQEAKINE